MKIFLSIFALCVCFWSASASTVDFTHYWSIEEISSYLDYLHHNYHDVAHIENYGITPEGRQLQGLHIDTEHGNVEKPVIFIEAGMRPREWIGVMTAMYFIHELVEHYYEFPNLLGQVEFVVVPVANPDGYAFTFSSDRQWNKNRRVNTGNPACPGVDLNANFGFRWLAQPGLECSPNFSGASSLSEVETQSLSQLLILGKYSGRVSIYVSLQAFGEQILTPFSSESAAGGNHAAMLNLANRVADTIRSRNPARNYVTGIGGALRALQFGTVTDYALSVPIPYVFTIMLPSGGASGFDPPTSQIAPIGSETFYGLLELGYYIIGQ